jgi:hypothetical protein
MFLKTEARQRAQGLADLLDYHSLIDDGILLLSSGRFLGCLGGARSGHGCAVDSSRLVDDVAFGKTAQPRNWQDAAGGSDPVGVSGVQP